MFANIPSVNNKWNTMKVTLLNWPQSMGVRCDVVLIMAQLKHFKVANVKSSLLVVPFIACISQTYLLVVYMFTVGNKCHHYITHNYIKLQNSCKLLYILGAIIYMFCCIYRYSRMQSWSSTMLTQLYRATWQLQMWLLWWLLLG